MQNLSSAAYASSACSTARMRKLQPNQQPGVGASRKPMLRNQLRAKLRKPSASVLRNHQLIRIRAPRANRTASPPKSISRARPQSDANARKVFSVGARPPVPSTPPSDNREAISDFDFAARQRKKQWRLRRRQIAKSHGICNCSVRKCSATAQHS